MKHRFPGHFSKLPNIICTGFVCTGLLTIAAPGAFAQPEQLAQTQSAQTESAQTQSAAPDRVNWQMASAFGSRLPQLGTLGQRFAQELASVSGGAVRFTFHEPNSLVAPLDMFDAVADGELDAAWSKSDFWVGKDEAFALFSAVPFGPRTAEYTAWYYQGGGMALMDELYGSYGLKSLLCGVTAPEASGWFREEITSLEDLNGLEMRFTGLGAKVVEKLGVVTQGLGGAATLSAMRSGKINATEFSMPAIDQNLGFDRVVKHYYFPGWHQQSTFMELLMNRAKWDALTPTQRAQIEVTCGDNIRAGLAEGEALQVTALEALQARGVMFHRWPPEILAALEAAWLEVASDIAARNSNFRKVWGSYFDFRKRYETWRELGYL